MRNLVLLIACLACVCHARRLQHALESLRISPTVEPQADSSVRPEDVPTFARFLLACEAVAAAFTSPVTWNSTRSSGQSTQVPIFEKRPLQPEDSISKLSLSPEMVAAKDVFQDYHENASVLQRSVLGLPLPPKKALVAGAAAIGFLAMPSYRILVKALGGLIASRIGSKLYDVKHRAALNVVAHALAKGEEFNEETLQQIARKCQMKVEQLKTALGEIYFVFLNACLQEADRSEENEELHELQALQKVLEISAEDLGKQFFKATKQIPSKDAIPKLTFFAERMLGQEGLWRVQGIINTLSVDESSAKDVSGRSVEQIRDTAAGLKPVELKAKTKTFDAAAIKRILEAKEKEARERHLAASAGETSAVAASTAAAAAPLSAAAAPAPGGVSHEDFERFIARNPPTESAAAAPSAVASAGGFSDKDFDEFIARKQSPQSAEATPSVAASASTGGATDAATGGLSDKSFEEYFARRGLSK